MDDFQSAEPIYRSVPGWSEPTVGITEFAALPQAARDYVRAIEDELAIPVGLIATGPKREETILRDEPRLAELTGGLL
jgi:adenylosuccinate synthase